MSENDIVEIKINEEEYLTGRKRVDEKYYNFEVKTYKRKLTLEESLGDHLRLTIDSFPEYSNFTFHPRRKPLDSPLIYNTLTIRRKANKRILVRFRIYPGLRSDEWEKPYNIDTYFIEAKKITSSKEGIKFVFFENKDKWAQIKVLDIIVFLDYDPNLEVGDIIEISYNKINDKIDQTDRKIDVIGRIRHVIEIWDNQERLEDEEYWQNILKDNSWIISQSLSIPEILFVDKAFLGGKSLENKDGKIVDFTFKNTISKNLTLIELKTPNTKLIGKSYRNLFSIGSELTGAIVQLLDYKETVQRYYLNLVSTSKDKFDVFSPTVILIAGSTRDMREKELYSFELFRREIKNVQIITYNELFGKIRILYNLLSNDIPKY